MENKIYVYLDDEGFVKEYVGYETEGFVETNLTYLDLPKNFTMGYYKYVDGKIKLDDEKKKELYGSSEITADDFNDLRINFLEQFRDVDEDLENSSKELKELEGKLAKEVEANKEKEKEISELKEENEFFQEQLAIEAMESIKKTQIIDSLQKENEITQEQIAMEMMNNLELESRLSSLEEKIERVENNAKDI